MKKIDKTAICKICNKSFDGGKRFRVVKTCSKKCNLLYLNSDEMNIKKTEKKKKKTGEKRPPASEPQPES